METEFNKVNPEQEADKPKKCTCRHKHGKIVAVILVILIVGAICWHVHPRPSGLKVGTVYKVQFRRDALGGSALVSPQTDNYNGADVCITGTLIAVYHDAILLEVVDHSLITVGLEMPKVKDEYRKTLFWIPKGNILFIEYKEPRPMGQPRSVI